MAARQTMNWFPNRQRLTDHQTRSQRVINFINQTKMQWFRLIFETIVGLENNQKSRRKTKALHLYLGATSLSYSLSFTAMVTILACFQSVSSIQRFHVVILRFWPGECMGTQKRGCWDSPKKTSLKPSHYAQRKKGRGGKKARHAIGKERKRERRPRRGGLERNNELISFRFYCVISVRPRVPLSLCLPPPSLFPSHSSTHSHIHTPKGAVHMLSKTRRSEASWGTRPTVH